MLDILNIKPTTISRTLKDKAILLYGAPKMGKTTFCAQSGALICGFEKGVNGLSGAMFVPVDKWSTFKNILRQLEKPEAQEKYPCIAIDTTTIAYTCCEDYICNQNGVSKISEIPYGARHIWRPLW